MLLFPVKMMAPNPTRMGFACLANLVAKSTIIYFATTQFVTVTSVISGTQAPVNILYKMNKPVLTTTRKFKVENIELG